MPRADSTPNVGPVASQDLKGKSLIGFGDGSVGGQEFHGINPVDATELAPVYHSATAAELDLAATLAAQAFPEYSRLPGEKRAAFLRVIAKRLEAQEDVLTKRMVLETALPLGRAKSELGRTCAQLRLFADTVAEGSWVNARIDPALPDRKPLPRPDLRSMLRPLGPVAVFCASNFPLAFSVAGGDTVSALAAGNTVVVKAHPAHPATAELAGMAMRESVRECGLPEGTFSLLFDAGIEIGTKLVQYPEIKAVGFTGSRAGGLALMKAASSRHEPIPFYAEMSSINPLFILPGAMRERGEQIAAGLHASMTLGAGQFCTKPGLIVLQAGAGARQFAGKLGELIGASPQFTVLNRGIQSAYVNGSAARARSAHVGSLAQTSAAEATGFQVAAVAFEVEASDLLRQPELSDELFGPSTLVVQYSDRQQLLAVARGLEGHLTATIQGTPDDLVEYRDLISILERKVGRLIFNGFPTGVEVSHAMVHGGPYPATSDGRSTSVGTMAIFRFARPFCFQGFPGGALPEELQDSNPLGIWRLVDGNFTRDPL